MFFLIESRRTPLAKKKKPPADLATNEWVRFTSSRVQGLTSRGTTSSLVAGMAVRHTCYVCSKYKGIRPVVKIANVVKIVVGDKFRVKICLFKSYPEGTKADLGIYSFVLVFVLFQFCFVFCFVFRFFSLDDMLVQQKE